VQCATQFSISFLRFDFCDRHGMAASHQISGNIRSPIRNWKWVEEAKRKNLGFRFNLTPRLESCERQCAEHHRLELLARAAAGSPLL